LDRGPAIIRPLQFWPPYSGPKFAPGVPLTPQPAIHTAPYIIACERRTKIISTPDGCVIDRNNKPSCGPGQFQDWSNFWEPVSRIYGDPNVSSTAVQMMLWGLEGGYIQKRFRWPVGGKTQFPIRRT
jgi:hypothetical protein